VTRFIRSTAFRLTAAYAGIGVLALLLFAGVLWWNSVSRFLGELDALIGEDARMIAEIDGEHGIAAAIEAVQRRVGDELHGRTILLLANANFERLAGNLPAWPLQADLKLGWSRVTIVGSGGRPLDDVRLLSTVLPDGAHLLIGRDLTEFRDVRALFIFGLLGAVAAVLVLGVVGGTLLHRAVLARVEAINRTAAAIVQGDLSRRLPVAGSGDELDLLAATINLMLHQIEQLVHGVRNVSNAIAHDLRTPLTELRARLEELARHRPEPPRTFAEIDAAVADVDRVIGIFNALLRLAEIDTGARRSGFVPVDIADIMVEIIELYQPTAELRDVALSLDAPHGLVISGDPFMIAQAVGNLIDNALKFVPAKGTVTARARRSGDGGVEIIVADDGPGIPKSERAKVIERFYRGDASRGTPGVGLGLSLVAAVAKLHGGVFELGDNHPGLSARLHLPAGSAAPRDHADETASAPEAREISVGSSEINRI
jgi:signal transduction histidine kinase